MLYTLASLSHRVLSREQRANLKFLTKLGKTPSESFEMLQQVYGEEALSRTRAFEWHKRFKEGREEVEDDLVWKTFNEQNGEQHRACEVDGAHRSSTYDADDC